MWRDKENEPGGFKGPKYWDAMVRYTDKMVGKVVNKLDELNLRENTLVIWTGDNGTYTSIVTPFHGRDYRGGKGSPKDNGTHVGFLASWPDQIPQGKTVDDLVDFSDVFPTVLDVAGVPTPQGLEIDGVSLAPTFAGKDRDKPYIYCWYERNGMRGKASQHVRDAQYKLYADGRLFDVVADPDEQNDLASEARSLPNPSRIKLLRDAIQKHVAVTEAADPIQRQRRQDFKE